MFDLKAAVAKADYVTFLTGAGVSTPSGIPDYRSKGGLYAHEASPEYLLSHDNLIAHPANFHQFVTESLYYPDAKPNVIHEKMAAISNAKGAIVTQNIDNLHQAAGAKNVVPFHGSLYRVYCRKCHQTVPYQTYLKTDRHDVDGGQLRPDVVLYGEGLDEANINAAVTAVRRADLIVICGTSLKVAPFSLLINERRPEAQVVVVNTERLALPFQYEMIQADAETVFADL
ncbi:NAD-dependent protein deacylase [Loigolactobacillus bifermentans]|jgi:NAD-dependent deacetylase|uniref:protein acetyllysine N-acetyltransferase n=1 Tax=Loigolactobacillus bifermentans DSM 20003 TaxID=1423726 RepID=A0A0R1GHF1_9LACO|nr:NAD-dependent protein deacylase [Loigolactobacillus bifermentans]KRK33432.1 hypothetical protein FC07_GL001193 [Loigolactobacillus bifermentans DSM 20003]QGG61424.1 NAD-dependent protein deacylase [Loigolactobacillus bifermentans]